MAFEFTDSNFQESAIDSGNLAVVDFWAVWCGPCRVIGPIIEELSTEYQDKGVTIGKVNVDENPGISAKFGIRNIPTVLFIKNGEVVDKQVGAVPKSVLEQTIQRHL